MAAKRIANSSIDWTRFGQIVSKSERHSFNAFKAKSDGYLRRMLSNPENPPQIDWSYYKKNIINKAIVDQLESAYKAVTVTYPKDTLTEQINDMERKAEEDVKEFITDSKQTIAEANKMLEKFNVMLPVKDMSEEEFIQTFPDQLSTSEEPYKPRLWNNDDNPNPAKIVTARRYHFWTDSAKKA